MKKRLLTGLALGAMLLGTSGVADATTIVGGTSLLTGANFDYLESVLNQGELIFNNIFDRDGSINASEFHAAADNQGATITVYNVLDQYGNRSIIGGYNDESWTSGNVYNLDSGPEPRSNFLFNLTNSLLQSQRTDIDLGDFGQHSTFNGPTYLATFGGGHDLYARGGDNWGYAYQFSYGSALGGNGYGYAGTNILGRTGVTYLSVLAIETFTIAQEPTPTPEPATMLLLGTGLAGLAGTRKRKRKA